jgi:hypothetical protein
VDYITNFLLNLQVKKGFLLKMPAHIALVACLKQAQKNKGSKKKEKAFI